MVFGRVVDLKTLGNTLAALVSSASVVLTVLYLLKPHSAAGSTFTSACSLIDLEVNTIRGVVANEVAATKFNST